MPCNNFDERDTMIYFLRTTLVVCLLHIAQSIAQASNAYYLPGDAFYHTTFGEDLAKSLVDDEALVLEYIRPEEFPAAFCGDRGNEQLKIAGMSKDLRQRVRQLYFDIRATTPKETFLWENSEGKEEWVESNKLHLLFYNHNMDFEKYLPFVKYNEDWLKPVVQGGNRLHIRLERFVPDWDGSEWRDSDLVPGLAVDTSKNPMEIAGPLVAVVFTPKDLERYKHRRNGAKFYLVTETETLTFQYRKGYWKQQTPKRSAETK